MGQDYMWGGDMVEGWGWGGGGGWPEWRQNVQVSGGGEDLGQETDREWRRMGPSPLRAKMTTRSDTKHQKITVGGVQHREG